jgi:hypothetical protein
LTKTKKSIKILKDKNMIIMGIFIVLYLVPLVVIPLNKSIPSFFELSGYIFDYKEMLTVSYFYIPFLGLLLSIFCITIYSKKYFENSIIFNKIILMSIFFTINTKFGINSMKIIFYINYNKNINIINIINNLETSLFKISVITLIFGIILFVIYIIPISEYTYKIRRSIKYKK